MAINVAAFNPMRVIQAYSAASRSPKCHKLATRSNLPSRIRAVPWVVAADSNLIKESLTREIWLVNQQVCLSQSGNLFRESRCAFRYRELDP